MGEDFRDIYRILDQKPQERKVQPQAIYTAKKGTATRAKQNKKRTRAKVASLILAAAIGLGGISLASCAKGQEQEPITITQLQENKENLQSLGLSEETLEAFNKYDEYFENLDSEDKYNLSEEEVLKMTSEIEDLHFLVVKEKIATLDKVSPSDVTMFYSPDNVEGGYKTTIKIYGDAKYGNFNTIKDSMPSDLAKVIIHIGSLDNIKSDIENDKISKLNAVKELKSIYKDLENVATSEFVKDKNNNISMIQFEEKDVQKNQIDKEER